MVEVFRTNVGGEAKASMVLDQIHRAFADYKANFDLEDCDKILRVKCVKGEINSHLVIDLLKTFGCQAEVLPDEVHVQAAWNLTG